MMNIEIKDRNRIKEFFQKLCDKAEDVMFSVIQRIPERFMPQGLMEWTNRYLDKRLNELKRQTVKLNWRNAYLQKAIEEIQDSGRG